MRGALTWGDGDWFGSAAAELVSPALVFVLVRPFWVVSVCDVLSVIGSGARSGALGSSPVPAWGFARGRCGPALAGLLERSAGVREFVTLAVPDSVRRLLRTGSRETCGSAWPSSPRAGGAVRRPAAGCSGAVHVHHGRCTSTRRRVAQLIPRR